MVFIRPGVLRTNQELPGEPKILDLKWWPEDCNKSLQQTLGSADITAETTPSMYV